MKLLRPLLPHQATALAATREWPNLFLHFAMRLGKTTTAIRRLLQRYGASAKVLVVAPNTVLIPWEKELKLEGVKARRLIEQYPCEALIAHPEIVSGFYLIGPARLRMNPEIAWKEWDAIVADESTFLKNPQAAITKVLTHVAVKAKERICLSGWATPEGPEEWFSQLQFLEGGSWMGCDNFWQWRHRFFRPVDFDWVPKQGTLLKIKWALENKVYFLSAEQAGVFRKFVEEERYVEMSAKQREIYRQVERDFAAEMEGKSLTTKWIPVQYMRMSQIASGECPWDDGTSTLFDAKVDELLWLFKGDLKKERRVVFFRFAKGVEMVAAALKEKKIPFRMITGATSQAERLRAIDDYQAGRCLTLLLQADCGKFGLNLSAGSVGIFYSMGLSFETFVQCRERFVHPEKRTANLLIYLTTKGTVEEETRTALRDKSVTGKYFQSKILEEILRRRK